MMRPVPDFVPTGILCSHCRPWAATSESMLANRLRMASAYPEVDFHSCPKCGSVGWVTSRQMIRPEPVKVWGALWAVVAFNAILLSLFALWMIL